MVSTSENLSQQELESWLWGAADILRGPVDPDHVHGALLLRRLPLRAVLRAPEVHRHQPTAAGHREEVSALLFQLP